MENQKIDFVIIWVDGNDMEWRKEKAKYDGSEINLDDSDIRYRDWDNLQYWFRGIEKFTPWVNKIHFVTWGHLPEWLDTTNPKLNIVNHKDYIPADYLPTFNSHTIELNLHRIEGLAEQFVYFNDDMFITNYMKPEDFFRDGKPLDTFALNAIYFGPNSAGTFNGADLEVINGNFDKVVEMKKNLSKWLNPSNGPRAVIRTLLLIRWPWFPGFFYNHLPSNFLKSTLEEVWKKEEAVLDATSKDRFRSKTNVNQWVFKFWQLASGNFVPRSNKIGSCFHIKETNFKAALDALKTGKYKLVCINDTNTTTDFENKKVMVQKAFHQRLSEKSSFEK